MICNVKTVTTYTLTCCECGFKLHVKAMSIREAERIAKEMEWTEKQFGLPLCADCSGEERSED